MTHTIDLESMTRADMIELREKLDQAISAAGERDRQRALKAAEDLVREHGFSLAELVPGAGGKGRGAGAKRKGDKKSGAAPRARPEAKYRNPDKPEETWSGRGRRPVWVNEALARGRELADLAT